MALELFLKKIQNGPEAVEALRYRTAIHYLNPSLDRLSNRVLKAYEKLSELMLPPFSLLDAGCMSGYLRHFLQLRIKPFTYLGLDCWDEALEVAREFQPDIDVRKCDLLTDEIPEFSVEINGHTRKGFDYIVCSNVNWGKKGEILVEKLLPLARRNCFFIQPLGTGGFIKNPAEVIDCGETELYIINEHNHLRGTSDGDHKLVA